MKKRLQILSCLFLGILFISLFPSVLADSGYSVYFDLSFKGNLLFAGYDIEVVLDDSEIATVKRGGSFSRLMENVPSGQHTITFNKIGDASVSGSRSFTIFGNTTIRGKVYTSSAAINTSALEQINDLAAVYLEMPDVNLLYLNQAEKVLKERGFPNVSRITEGNESIWDASSWIVVGQNYNPGETINKNASILLQCKRVSAFLGDTFRNLPVPDAQKLADDLGFSVQFADAVHKRKLTDLANASTPEGLRSWSVTEGEPISANGRKVRLYAAYTGEVEMPDLIGLQLNNAIKVLEDYNFSNLSFHSANGSSVLFRRSWVVEGQNIPAGSMVPANEAITLNCYKPGEKVEETVETPPVPVHTPEILSSPLIPSSVTEGSMENKPVPSPVPLPSLAQAPVIVSGPEISPSLVFSPVPEASPTTAAENGNSFGSVNSTDALAAYYYHEDGYTYLYFFNFEQKTVKKFRIDGDSVLTGTYTEEDPFHITIIFDDKDATQETGRWTSSGDKSSYISARDIRYKKFDTGEAMAALQKLESSPVTP